MITLENREARLRTYEIPVVIGGGEAHMVGALERVSDATAKAGSATLRVVERTFPTTLTLTARNTEGSISEPLPDRYEEAPAIRAALADRRLLKRVVPVAESPAPSPPAEPLRVDDSKGKPVAKQRNGHADERKD